MGRPTTSEKTRKKNSLQEEICNYSLFRKPAVSTTMKKIYTFKHRELTFGNIPHGSETDGSSVCCQQKGHKMNAYWQWNGFQTAHGCHRTPGGSRADKASSAALQVPEC